MKRTCDDRNDDRDVEGRDASQVGMSADQKPLLKHVIFPLPTKLNPSLHECVTEDPAK